MEGKSLQEYLNKRHFPLEKSLIHTNNLLCLFANAFLFYFFRNVAISVIGIMILIVMIVIILKNKNYLDEYDSSLLVRAWISGYWSCFLMIFVLLFQLKIKVSYWFLALEILLLIVTFIFGKKSFKKIITENKNGDTDFSQIRKRTIAISAPIYFLLNCFQITLSSNAGLFIISTVIFIFAMVACYLFSFCINMYISYMKLCYS